MEQVVIKQGAEGVLYLGEYAGKKCLIKERLVKTYRHPELDTQIARQRTRAEVKAVSRASNAGILVPKIYCVNYDERKIYMEYFENATTATQYISKLMEKKENTISKDKCELYLQSFCERLGDIIRKMHSNHIIHGDLTTSNILLNPKNNSEQILNDDYDIILIDFGLSCYSDHMEDKGVDLYVLERALISTHSSQPFLFNRILEAYKRTCSINEQNILKKLDEIRLRGRKRTLIG